MNDMPFDGIVVKATVEELQETLLQGKITKIHQPTDTELILTIRSNRKNHPLLLSVHSTYARMHLTGDQFDNPPEPTMFCMVLRKHLSGAILDSIEQLGMERIIEFSFQARNEIGDWTARKLIVEIMGRHSNIILVNEEKEVIIDSIKHISMAQNRHRTILPGADYKLPPSQHKWNPLELNSADFIKKLDFNAGKLDMQMVQLLEGVSPIAAREIIEQAQLGSQQAYEQAYQHFQTQLLQRSYQPTIYRNKKEDFHVIPISTMQGEQEQHDSTNAMLDAFYSGKAERDRVKQQARDLYRFIKNETDKNIRKKKKHQQAINKAKDADRYRKYGELLTANMHLVKPGDASVQVLDYYEPEQREVTIKLDPRKTPSENAQAFFKSYRKLTNSKKMLQGELKKATLEINYLEQLLQQLDVARTSDIEEIREELREEGYLKKQAKRKQKRKPAQPAPEVYTASDGTTILVGKNNKQNEYVTTKLAHRDDVWLHTKDIPGSHVVIRSKEPEEETLLEAAQLAAYFSKSQQSSSVPVDYTTIRHVKKPNGAKPGYVTYDNQKTIFVTPDKAVIDKLKK